MNMRDAISGHLCLSIGKTPEAATISDWRLALSRAVRDQVVRPWFDATRRTYAEDRKRVYYLSMEFLIGRLLEDAVANLGLEEAARAALEDFGVDYDAVIQDEPDAALGNGGLGRLAACFMDSMSSLGVPAFGYGIRYEHGLFRQSFANGWQVEEAEDWLRQVNPWEFERAECAYPIGFGGKVTGTADGRAEWRPEETIIAAGYDTPIPGWRGVWTNTLRLWSAKPTRVFDLEPFNRGDYLKAAAPAMLAETISRVLYPDDTTPQGKELRLKQEYFFTAASIRDLMRRFLSDHGDVGKLPSKVAIQLNDTHPAIAGPELIRLLIDEHGQDFDTAFDIAQGCLHYTNHTLMPEALERWPGALMSRVLPRHMDLIERIDDLHARRTRAAGRARPNQVRIVEANGEVRMGDLAFISARRVNGVSALHTELMRKTVFRDLDGLHPDRIVNQTNGVTPRRWLYGCNPALGGLLIEAIGDGWIADLEQLKKAAPLVEDGEFRARFAAAKRANKQDLCSWLAAECGVAVDPSAIFDIQIKRIHEYKRQLLNILEAAALYNAIRRDPQADWTPRVKIFGGKAAPGYAMAKLIIKLINDVAKVVNSDPVIGDRLKIVFPANYNVSMAETLIPAADLSEQISTAGMEASGTGNMKFALNGALTIGTLDGANVEIRERVGEDNIFIFGLTADQVAATRPGYSSRTAIEANPALREVIGQIAGGRFSPDNPARYAPLIEKLYNDDYFMVAADFTGYWEAQRRIDREYRDAESWIRKAVLNTTRSGWFSSDRTIRGYARDVWDVAPLY